MLSDHVCELLIEIDSKGIIASGMDVEGVVWTLQKLQEMEDAGWKFEPPKKVKS